MNSTVRYLLLGLASGCAGVYAGLWLLYAALLPPEPELPRPDDLDPVPPRVASALWASFGYEGPPRLVPVGPGRMMAEVHCQSRARSLEARHRCLQARPGLMFAVQVARHATEPRRGNQHFQNGAVTIWVTRHWTVEEVIARVAAVSYFAPDTVGVESAARLMFGQSAGNLTAHQAALLAAAHRRPALLLPWCDRERALREARIILERMVGAGLITREAFQRQEAEPPAIRLLPLQVGSCATR